MVGALLWQAHEEYFCNRRATHDSLMKLFPLLPWKPLRIHACRIWLIPNSRQSVLFRYQAVNFSDSIPVSFSAAALSWAD
jgi:hypothetical protein